MIFHENRLLTDNSHVISYIFLLKIGKMSQNLSSAAVAIGALRVKDDIVLEIYNTCLTGKLSHVVSGIWLRSAKHTQKIVENHK